MKFLISHKTFFPYEIPLFSKRILHKSEMSQSIFLKVSTVVFDELSDISLNPSMYTFLSLSLSRIVFFHIFGFVGIYSCICFYSAAAINLELYWKQNSLTL